MHVIRRGSLNWSCRELLDECDTVVCIRMIWSKLGWGFVDGELTAAWFPVQRWVMVVHKLKCLVLVFVTMLSLVTWHLSPIIQFSLLLYTQLVLFCSFSFSICSTEMVQVTPLRRTLASYTLSNCAAVVAVSKGMQIVKHCSNIILQLLTGGGGIWQRSTYIIAIKCCCCCRCDTKMLLLLEFFNC